jgi:hypothetical protein
VADHPASFTQTELGRVDFHSGGCLRFVESSAELRVPALRIVLERPSRRALSITVLGCHLDALQAALDTFRRRLAARPQPAPWSHEDDDVRDAWRTPDARKPRDRGGRR